METYGCGVGWGMGGGGGGGGERDSYGPGSPREEDDMREDQNFTNALLPKLPWRSECQSIQN